MTNLHIDPMMKSPLPVEQVNLKVHMSEIFCTNLLHGSNLYRPENKASAFISLSPCLTGPVD